MHNEIGVIGNEVASSREEARSNTARLLSSNEGISKKLDTFNDNLKIFNPRADTQQAAQARGRGTSTSSRGSRLSSQSLKPKLNLDFLYKATEDH